MRVPLNMVVSVHLSSVLDAIFTYGGNYVSCLNLLVILIYVQARRTTVWYVTLFDLVCDQVINYLEQRNVQVQWFDGKYLIFNISALFKRKHVYVRTFRTMSRCIPLFVLNAVTLHSRSKLNYVPSRQREQTRFLFRPIWNILMYSRYTKLEIRLRRAPAARHCKHCLISTR